MKDIFVITGQTATGKTNYALKLAKEHNGELINCDSRQIYKELDIVTGKDVFDSKVWLYDIVTPEVVFSSIDYVKACLEVIKDILKRGRTPIIVGGTYFYLKHLLYNTPEYTSETDWELRNNLEEKSVVELQGILNQKDTAILETMNNSDKNNPRRLIRRIEILNDTTPEVFVSSQPSSVFCLEEKLGITGLNIQITGFYRENRETMREVIKQRVIKRLDQGAVQETKELLRKYSVHSPGLQSIGYQQIIQFIDGNITEEQLIEDWTNKEYQYAKRQYTFMKQDHHISWINIP